MSEKCSLDSINNGYISIYIIFITFDIITYYDVLLSRHTS